MFLFFVCVFSNNHINYSDKQPNVVATPLILHDYNLRRRHSWSQREIGFISLFNVLLKFFYASCGWRSVFTTDTCLLLMPRGKLNWKWLGVALQRNLEFSPAAWEIGVQILEDSKKQRKWKIKKWSWSFILNHGLSILGKH